MPHSGAVPVPKCRAASVSTSAPVPADAAAACRPHTHHHHTAAALMLTGLPCVQLPCPHAAPPVPRTARPVRASWLWVLRIPVDAAVLPGTCALSGTPATPAPRPCPFFEAPRHRSHGPLVLYFLAWVLRIPADTAVPPARVRSLGHPQPRSPRPCPIFEAPRHRSGCFVCACSFQAAGCC